MRYRQTDFTPKRVVVSRLHDTVARYRTGVKFSPPYNNQGDSRRHDILWWYHVNKCRAMRGNRSELAPLRKSPRCHVNTPLLCSHCEWLLIKGSTVGIGFNRAKTNCEIAHILGVLLINSNNK